MRANTIIDRYGNKLAITRDANFNLTNITSSTGRFVNFSYDTSNRIVAAIDNMGRQVSYAYNLGGQLTTVTDPSGNVETYTYDTNPNLVDGFFSGSNDMLTVVNKRGITAVTNVYDSYDRVSQQTFADGSANTFNYVANYSLLCQSGGTQASGNATVARSLSTAAGSKATVSASEYSDNGFNCIPLPPGQITQATVTDGNGNQSVFNFNTAANPTSEVFAQGTSIQQTYTYQRDPNTGLITTVIDPLNRQTAFTYDSLGNTLSVTKLAGTANAVTTSLTYNNFGQVTSITDPLLHTVNLTYDTLGNLTQIQDANGNITKLTSTAMGQIASVTNALGNTTTLKYDVGDLVKVIDALSNTVNITPDAVGRPIAVADPLGNVSQATYTTTDQVNQTTNALGKKTGIIYDPSGNLTQVTDANNHAHVYAYDYRNNLAMYTDPLSQSEGYLYDANNNLKKKTDRKKQVATITYDALDQPSTITYADHSTVTWTIDLGNRTTKIVDSLNGTISYTYDLLDRVTNVATSTSNVAYTYYANGLRQTMTVSGQPTVTYAYDNGNRITQITQAAGATNNNIAQTVTYTYDAANRRTQTLLANGISENYEYDSDDRLLGITYDQAGTVIGTLTYGYDANGHRTSIGGSFARITPLAAATGIADANNRLTNFNGTTLSYDANGNLLNDEANTYTWNVRNQLVAISGAVTASFAYDAIGRRVGKTINGIQSNYVYDGWNIVAETISGTTYLNGLGIDEHLAMQTGSGVGAQTNSYLTDALRSTLRLTDMNGNDLVDYTYSMYGSTSATAVNNNPFQYAGRENDGDGLYYYRARYYSPAQHRFISSDPIGLNGGVNMYAYVDGNPLSNTDPYGLTTLTYDNNSHTLTVKDNSGNTVGTFPAYNNAQSTSNGPWSAGTYNYGYSTTHPGDSPDSQYGSNGNLVFNVPGHTGMGVHSGRQDTPDLAGRSGPQHATDGCIRTTDNATQTIHNLINNGDPVTTLTVQR